MKKFFVKLWEGWKKVGFFIGNVISNTFLTIFYFVILLFFAVPFRIFSKPLSAKSKDSNFYTPEKDFKGLEAFNKEF